MFILDTNILSELMDSEGAVEVLRWVDPVAQESLFTTALNQAEILYGIAAMSKGRRRNEIIACADAMFAEDFRGRILPFDERAAGHFAEIVAGRKRVGRPSGLVDSQIAAIARVHAMAVVTRNTKHFQDCDVPVINPWRD
jgi:predicted nucleic acid-binding protein